jgi:hypothetical protein
MLGDSLFDTLTTRQLAALTSTQILGLTTTEIATLNTAEIGALSANALNALNSDQVSSLDATDIAALKTSQLTGLKGTTVQLLSADQFKALTTGQLKSLIATQLKAITTDQLAALSMAQATALLANPQKSSLSSEQLAALTASPLVLDLDGLGINTLNINAGVQFDIRGDGSKVNTGWVGSGDGLLALDRNGDGVINDGSELFGTGTNSSTGSTGGKAANGFAALADLDSNHDGVIDSKDAQFGDLRVWVDGNADGVSQADELKTLASLHIASLTVASQAVKNFDNGNWIGLQSSYTSTDGSTHEMSDVWFQAGHAGDTSALSSAISGYQQASAAASTAATTAKLETTPAASNLNGHVAALASELQHYQATAALSGTATAQHDDWLRKQATSHAILAAK